MNLKQNTTLSTVLLLWALIASPLCTQDSPPVPPPSDLPPPISPKKPSQIKEIENSVYEETSEFESADFIKDSKTMDLGKIYELNQNWIRFTATEDLQVQDERFHLITIKGSGTFAFKMNDEAPYTVVLNDDYEMSYVPVNSHFFLGGKGSFMEISRIAPGDNLEDVPAAKIELVDCLDMEFNQNHRIVSLLVDSLRYKVTRPDLHLNNNGKEDRLQFILQSSLNSQDIMGGEEIAMFINKGDTFPTRSNYDFMATGNMGYGLIKSLSEGNKHYCIEKDCEFRVSIYVKDIDMIYFFPTVFANFSQIRFKKYLFLLEEVEGKKIVSYELDVPKHPGDWAFTIQPMEGSPKMYVNPDEIPESLSLYKYKTLGKRAEELTITFQESETYGFSHQKFFVSFESLGNEDAVATFKFEVKKLRKNEPKFLKLDYAESGVVANEEIVHYRLKFEVDEPEYINFTLEHTAIVGKSMLVLKECKDDDQNCQVTPDDVMTCQQYALTSKGQNPDRNSVVNVGDSEMPNPARVLQGVQNNQYPPQNYGQYPQQGYNNQGYSDQGYNNQGYNNQGYPPQGYTGQNQGYPPQGYTGQNQGYPPQANQPSNPPYQQIPPEMLNTGSQGVPTWKDNSIPVIPPNGMPNLPNTQNMYFPDKNLGSGINNDEMLNYQEIQDTWAKQKDQQAGQYSNMDPYAVPPSAKSPDAAYNASVGYDKNNRPINPAQNNLTDMRHKELVDVLADPKKSQKFIQHMMDNKDKELGDIFDYTNQDTGMEGSPKAEELPPHLRDTNPMANTYSDQGSDDDILQEFENSKVDENAQEIEYNLDKEVDESDIRCVSAFGDKGVHQTKKLIMEFNCLGKKYKNQGRSFEQLNPYVPYSNLCKFALGVYGANTSKKYGGSFYSITGTGGLEHETIKYRKSTEVIIQEAQTKYLRMSLKHIKVTDRRFIQVKVVAITGSCRIFASRFDMYPNEFDFEDSIEFTNEHFMSVRTSEKKLKIPYDTKGQFKSLFIGIEAKNYCVLDFYVQMLEGKNESDSDKHENLTKGKMIRRRMNSDDLDPNKTKSNRNQYVKNFVLETDYESFKRDGSIKVVLNSNVLGLHLCLQKNRSVVNLGKPCDVTSHSGVAVISDTNNNLEFATQWGVGVVYAPKHKPKLPAEFSIMYFEGNDSSTHLKILNPGRSFSSHLKKGESVIVQVNLLSVAKNSIIILTSEDKSVKGEISLNKFDFTKTKYVLDNEKFALEINHKEEEVLCRNDDKSPCIFFIKISSLNEHRSRFSLTYTFDDVPITVREGHELFIPNKDPLYFLYDPNPLYPVQINLESDITEFVIYSRIVKLEQVKRMPLDKLLTEMDFDYKTDIGLSEQLRIPQKHVEKAGDDALVAYLIVPKFFANQSTSPVTFYSTSETTRVVVKSRMSELTGFTQGVARLKKGEFRHFFFHVDNPKDFSLVMTVHSGHADLYLNRGMFNLPTKKAYWKRRRGSRGEELLVTTSMFKTPDEIMGTYTAGIYAESNCRISVFFLPSFKNLIKLKQQHLLRMEIQKDKDYYFEFFNKLPKYDMDLYTEDSDLEVSIMNYQISDKKNNKLKNQSNFMDMLGNDNNYMETFTFQKGSVPLKHHEENPTKNRHYIVRVKAKESDSHINIGIFDPGKPVILPCHRRNILVGDPEQEYIYQFELTGDFDKVKLDVKLSFGNVDIFFGDDLESLEKRHSMKVPSTKDFSFRAPAKKNDIVIFSHFFVKIKANKFSKFSLLVRGEEKFREIRDFESEVVYTLPDEDQFIYYYISTKKLEKTKSLVFDLYTVNFYGDQPKFLYNPDNDDIELDKETKLLAMPRLDYTEQKTREFRHYEMRPEIRRGYYIIKIPRNKKRMPIKISVGHNDVRSIEVNGVYRSQLPGGSVPVHKYSEYFPEKGEFRFLVESCDKAAIMDARLNVFMEEPRPIVFPDNLVEGSSFYFKDNINKKAAVLRSVLRPVFRARVEAPGVLEFDVQSKESKQQPQKMGYNKDYALVSEFKPATKDNFMKDYLNMWNRSDDTKKNVEQFNVQWIQHNRKLQVDLDVPIFREQLLIDYPDLKVIVVKYFVFLFDDPDFAKRLELCGIEALEEIPHAKMSKIKTISIKAGELNKPSMTQFVFREKELKKFRTSRNLSVFSYMSISFFENELEEFEVGLELKFTNQPFFHLIMRNEYAQSTWSILKVLGMVCVVMFILFLLLLACSNKGNTDIRDMVNATAHSRQGYSAGNDSFNASRNQIQMSEMRV